MFSNANVFVTQSTLVSGKACRGTSASSSDYNDKLTANFYYVTTVLIAADRYNLGKTTKK